MNLNAMRETITNTFLINKQCEEIPEDNYTNFSYPRWFGLMKFNTQRYKVPGFGHFMTMHTKTLFNMELLTTSFMPGEGVSIPYLLIDIMTFGKKRTIFIEYYDCTANHPSMKNLEAVKDLYTDIPEYQEKPNWYINERASYSLIKGGTNQQDEKLSDMIVNSIKAYNKELKEASIDKNNLKGLSTFRDRMINEGNPSSSILEKVFGKEGSKDFFTSCVMPM